MAGQSDITPKPASRPVQNPYSWTILALLGFSSGILSMTAPALKGPGLYFFIGGVFGAALSTYLVLCKGYRSVSKMVLLVVVAIGAYFAAVNAPLYFPLSLPFLGGGQGEIPLSFIFEGGVVGGLLLLTGIVILFRLPGPPNWADLLKVTLWSLASGLLGVIGWVLGPSVGNALWTFLPTAALPSGDTLHYYSLYPVWQTGFALLVGFIAHGQEKQFELSTEGIASRRGPSNQENFFFTRRKFLGVVIALLVLTGARATPIRVRVARRQRAIDRMQADIPPNEGLPPIQQIANDEAFIMSDIAGFHPGEVFIRRDMPIHERSVQMPPAITYGVSYKPNEDNSPNSSAYNVSVVVVQYPNSPWALHLAEYPPRTYNSYDNPKHHAIATRFQNKVRTNFFERIPNAVSLYYMWPSGNNVVTLTYNTRSEVPEFLRAYLEKYPSSIK